MPGTYVSEPFLTTSSAAVTTRQEAYQPTKMKNDMGVGSSIKAAIVGTPRLEPTLEVEAENVGDSRCKPKRAVVYKVASQKLSRSGDS